MDTRQRAEDVFEAALELEPAERSEYVARVCAYDPALLRQVRALLGAHERAEGVLELDAATFMRAAAEPMPERLGAYRLVREIGRGGMGVVYEAERDDGQFLRRVAIKLLRADHDPALRQRVLAERQILASLEHSDIARLLDGGVTPDGRPYLVMEHVEGLPVDVFCDRMQLSVPERLRLFNVIARAVAYAHRNLIVHRDLKPSNIMVTADGQVKLLDFGVAKLLHRTMRGFAAHTLPDRLAFTPEYASPEQLRGEAMTTVSDVYALGVLLYELLTGTRPFAAAGLAPLLKAVSDDEPEPPSARVMHNTAQAQLDGATREVDADAVARARHTTPARLARTLRGDLDAIVAMALRKEPLRRYGSAELLVEDVERYLDGRPVLAQRRGRAYALGKLVRRHRTAAGAVALGALSLVVGAAAAITQAAAAREQRDRAQAARAEAEQLTTFMVDLFSTGAPGGPVQGSVSARDLIRRGTARVDGLSDRPLVQARLLGALSRAYEGLGEYEEGQRLTQRALSIHRAQPNHDRAVLGELLLQHGIMQRRRSEFDSAQATFTAARAAVQDVPAPPAIVASIMNQYAGIAVYLGDLLEAERRATEAYERLLAEFGETSEHTVNALSYLASVQWRRGKLEAEATFRRVLELRPRVPGHTRLNLMGDRMALANMQLTERLRLDEAEATFRSVVSATPVNAPELIYLGVWARSNLAVVLEERGEFAEAERLRREDLAMRRAVHGDAHPGNAESMIVLARLIMNMGRLDEAEQIYHDALTIIRNSVGERHALFAGWLFEAGRLQLVRGNPRAADSLLTRGVELRGELGGRHGSQFALSLLAHAEAKTHLGEYELAERMLRDALAMVGTQLVPGARETRRIHDGFAQLYTAWGRREEAERHRRLSQPLPIWQ